MFAALAQLELETDENGLPISEVTDPANEFAYIADPRPLINYATKTRLDAKDQYLKNWPDANTNGAYWDVQRRT